MSTSLLLSSFCTCMATGKSFWASGGKKTSTAFFGNGWFPVGGVPTSMICSYKQTNRHSDKSRQDLFLNTFLCFIDFHFSNESILIFIIEVVCLALCSNNKSYLSSCLSSHSKAEQGGLLSIILHLELCKASGVTLDGLRHLSVHWVQLHCSNYTILLKRRKRSQVRPKFPVILNSMKILLCKVIRSKIKLWC